MSRTIFFTGFPGFIGKRLVKKILGSVADAKFYFLVEPRFVEIAEKQAEILASQFAKANLQVLAGDISVPDLKFSTELYERLVGEVTDVFHLAAIYDLAVPEELARKVNVGGTENIIAFCKQCRNIRKFVYFSTCYVAGDRTGKVTENDLAMGQHFKNHYESTKYEAEIKVREAMSQIPTIIIRPSVVVGDSQTGETQKFDGPYFAMILFSKFNFGLRFPYVGEADAFVNLVPIDFIVNASLVLWLKSNNQGTTYQLADPNPLLAREIYRIACEEITGIPPCGSVPSELMRILLGFRLIRKLVGMPQEVLIYFEHKVEYDTSNTQRDLAGSGVSCPAFTSYYQTLIKFFMENRHRRELYWKAF
jgi:nucleoside-diphosphate-sugar epimerase